MNTMDELRYIQAFSQIVGVKEEDAIAYTQRKGMSALLDNAAQLLDDPVQQEKHRALMDLYRLSQGLEDRKPIINSPEIAAHYFRSVMDRIHDQEAFVVAHLNTRSQVIDHDIVSLGGLNTAAINPREVFRNAIVNKAKSIIVCHNHPTGFLNPSQSDMEVTNMLTKTGNMLGIQVLDHIIIGGLDPNRYFSLAENGLMETNGVQDMIQDVREDIPVKTNPSEALKEILGKLETGIRDFFSGDQYQTYLKTMGRFHKYSLNNTLLIAMQNPNATKVAGFTKWQDDFGRNVKKGEKGIRIIAPSPYKVKSEQPQMDPHTKKPVRDENGKIVMQPVEEPHTGFRVVSVFDVSQTEGKPLPTIDLTLTGNVSRYEDFLTAMKAVSPVPILFEPLERGDGYFSPREQTIHIREGMSEVQTLSALVHEITHARLHNDRKGLIPESDDTPTHPQSRDRRTEEVVAESVSYAVCSHYGVETDGNSFGYIAAWSKGRELPELRNSLEVISSCASSIIQALDKELLLLPQGRESIPSASHPTEPVMSAISNPGMLGSGQIVEQRVNPLRSVEDTQEQNDNQLDGVLNNLPAFTNEGNASERRSEPVQTTSDETQHPTKLHAALHKAHTPRPEVPHKRSVRDAQER